MITKDLISEKIGGFRMKFLKIDVERAKELFYLDDEIIKDNSVSGLRHKVNKANNKIKAGDVAGFKRKDNYWYVRINNKQYLAQRVIMAIFNNEDLGNVRIEHINGKYGDYSNNPSNLRKATAQLNSHNAKKYKRNRFGEKPTSKYPGATYHKASKKWQSEIMKNGKKIYLGLFESELEAYKTYLPVKRAHTCKLELESLGL